MSFQQNRNEYEEFQEKFGDYLTYDLNREQVLDGFYAAYQKEKPLEQLVVVEEPESIEDDLFEHFSESSSWLGSILSALNFSDTDAGDEGYAAFMDDFEIEPTEEEMMYRCRYDP